MVKLDYLDFELKIVGQDGRYEVHVLRSPAGEARCEFQRSLSDDQLEVLLLKLSRVRSVTRRIDPPQLAAARQIGAELFRATFRDTVRDCLRSSIAAAQRNGCGLRLKLRLQDAPELAVLPWEFLYDPDAARFLARSAYTPIVRYVELPESIPAIKTVRPLRMLGIIASPQDYDGLDVARERKLLEDALAPLVESGQLEISWLEKPTLTSLRRALRKDSYHILHFIGHGGFHEQTQQGVLVFEDDRANGALVGAEMLGVLLHDHHSLRLVVLNACEGARNAADDPFAGVATTLVRQGIPAVVAMQFVITDKAALEFAEEFYAAIADGFPVDTAMAEARKAVLAAPNEVEWGTPVLFLRTASGVLFNFPVKVNDQQVTAVGDSIRQGKSSEPPLSPTIHEAPAIQSEETGLDVRNATALPPPTHDEPHSAAMQTDQVDEELQQYLTDLWLSALTAFYSRDWVTSIRSFQSISELDPNYGNVAVKLAEAQRQQRLAKYYSEALDARSAGHLQEAASTLKQVLAEDSEYKDAAAVLENILTAVHYENAVTLANAGRWNAAIEVLDEISTHNPSYPDPKQLRAVAQAALAEQLRRKELENLLSQALICIEAADWPAARLKLTDIQAIEPDYKGSEQLLLRATEEVASLQLSVKHVQEQVTQSESWIRDTPYKSATGAILFVLGAQLGLVHSLAFSPNGKVIACVSSDNTTVQLWDAVAGVLLRTVTGHKSGVKSVAFSPDGKVIASGSSDRTVRLWDAATGKDLRTLTGHGDWVKSVAFSPDGKVIASGSSDRTVRLWDAATGKDLRTLTGHESGVNSVAFSPDGKVIASGSDDKIVRLWDAATGVLLRTLTGHESGVNSVAFSPDGKVIASGSDDKIVRLWDAATGVLLRTLTGHESGVNSVAFSPDGKVIASGSDDKIVRLWDAATGVLLRTVTGHKSGVKSVAFSPDGKVIASGSSDRTVRLWDAATGVLLRTLTGHESGVNSVAFSPDGKVIASGSDDKIVRLWDAATGVLLRTLTGHESGVNSVAFSPDGKVIASGSDDKIVRLWDAATGKDLRTPTGHISGVSSIGFSPDAKVIASGDGDYAVRLWDAATGTELLTLEGHDYWVRSVAFSPDGNIIASGSDDRTVRLWDAATAAALRTLEGHEHSVNSVVFSPDGEVIASGSDDGTVRLWNAATGVALRTLEGHEYSVNSVVFGPDGKVIASGSDDGTVRLWDAATAAALRTLEGHESSVNSVAFSPDGKVIASGSDDSTVRLWDVPAA